MAAFDYSSKVLLAERLIGKFGRTVTLVRRDRTSGDAAQPWRGPADPGTDESVTLKAVLLDFDSENVDGRLVRHDDMKALVAAKDVTDALPAAALIEEYDRLVDGTFEWAIQGVKSLQPGDTRIAYELHLRK